MKTIYKYQIPLTPQIRLFLPEKAEILTVQIQNGIVTMWAIVDTNTLDAERMLAVYGTDYEIPDNHGKYIATVQYGILVWHVFDLGEQQQIEPTPER